jgi:hypothetical protein
VAQKSDDVECNQEISDAVVARQTEFWYQRRELENKNDIIYKKIEANLNSQLEALGN